MHAALEFQICLFPVEGRLRKTPFVCEEDERACGKWGVECVAPVLYMDQHESQSLLLVLIAAVFQSP